MAGYEITREHAIGVKADEPVFLAFVIAGSTA